ncbi:MAG: SDR family oxidoreductase [Chitinophagaceae bacterium]|nr:SDR family oxidoreductase [Chitinophagaceae bacterium]
MKYALITGSSRGIGKAMAEILAAKKQNLLLVARTAGLLESLANSLKQQYGIDVDWFAVDLTEPGASVKILQWCTENEYSVDILINNAGYGLSGSFDSFSAKEQTDMMQVNMNVLVELCALFLPELKKAPAAHILNIASTASYQAVPGLSLYAASKSFVRYFSRGLRHELKHTGVRVTTVCPGGTNTDFAERANLASKARKAGEKVNMSSEAVAKIAINAMYAGKAEVITGFINKLGATLVWLLPKKISETVAAGIYNEG